MAMHQPHVKTVATSANPPIRSDMLSRTPFAFSCRTRMHVSELQPKQFHMQRKFAINQVCLQSQSYRHSMPFDVLQAQRGTLVSLKGRFALCPLSLRSLMGQAALTRARCGGNALLDKLL